MAWRLIETDLGWFGLGWGAEGISRVLLPGQAPEAMRAAMMRWGEEQAVGPDFADAAEALIWRYARGEAVSFADLPLELAGAAEFHQRAYDDIRRLGWGETTTYGEIARRLGDVALSRAVGQAMGANPIPLIIPCHRVLASGGKAGGFSAPGGAEAKLRMLALEGVSVGPHSPDQLNFGF